MTETLRIQVVSFALYGIDTQRNPRDLELLRETTIRAAVHAFIRQIERCVELERTPEALSRDGLCTLGQRLEVRYCSTGQERNEAVLVERLKLQCRFYLV